MHIKANSLCVEYKTVLYTNPVKSIERKGSLLFRNETMNDIILCIKSIETATCGYDQIISRYCAYYIIIFVQRAKTL